MKLLADENLPAAVVERLRNDGHDVLSVREWQAGVSDEVILQNLSPGQVLITEDKDFGDLVFQRRLPSQGIILVRLRGLTIKTRAQIVAKTIEQYAKTLQYGFTVVSPNGVRHQRLDETDG